VRDTPLYEDFQGVRIRRSAPIALHRFTDFFQNFDKVPSVREIFKERTEEVLDNLMVEFYSSPWGFMSVSEKDGHLLISAHYLETGDLRDIYLDIVHELVHVKQYLEGRPLYDERFSYVERPTEIEAYAYSIKEGRRIGMTDEELFEYLKTPWLTDEEVRRLAALLGLRVGPSGRGKA
jgi:hypothetical protein